MIWALESNRIDRGWDAAQLSHFLNLGLGVAVVEKVLVIVELREHEPLDHGCSGSQSRFDIDRAKHGLNGIGEQVDLGATSGLVVWLRARVT